MSEVITTTANRVKAGSYWCESATTITQRALDKHGLMWDDEIPVAWGLENLGLANTMLALGSVRPKFKVRADAIIIRLMRKLYTTALELGHGAGFTATNCVHWLGNPDRASSCKAQCYMWTEIKQDQTNPGLAAVAEAMAILFSTQEHHIACVHAGKLILFAASKLIGEQEAKALRQELIDFIRQELEA